MEAVLLLACRRKLFGAEYLGAKNIVYKNKKPPVEAVLLCRRKFFSAECLGANSCRQACSRALMQCFVF